MAGVYHPRHPERTVLYRVLFHNFERFLTEYEGRFEKEYGFLRPLLALERLSLDEKERKVCYRIISHLKLTSLHIIFYHP